MVLAAERTGSEFEALALFGAQRVGGRGGEESEDSHLFPRSPKLRVGRAAVPSRYKDQASSTLSGHTTGLGRLGWCIFTFSGVGASNSDETRTSTFWEAATLARA